jgi:ankyrin repeat protein
MISCPTGKHIGSHINRVDKSGETALHYAARYGHVAVLSLLLASRADTRMFGTQGVASDVRPGSSDTTQGPRALSLTQLLGLHAAGGLGGEAGRPHEGS